MARSDLFKAIAKDMSNDDALKYVSAVISEAVASMATATSDDTNASFILGKTYAQLSDLSRFIAAYKSKTQ